MCTTDLKKNIKGEGDGERFIFYLSSIIFSVYKASPDTLVFLAIPGENVLRIFSYNELQTATHDFCGENMIAEGAFGPVFKVICIIDHFNGVLVSILLNLLAYNLLCVIREGLKMEWLSQ